MGREYNLAADLRNDSFRRRLTALGMELVIKGSHREWHDYRDVDVVLALRDIAEHWIVTKPATKLYNSWHAGCPAVLGREPAFEALRQSELDYLPIASADDALAALARLRDDPQLYAAMVENGQHRAAEYTPDAVAARWCEFLWGPVAAHYATWRRHSVIKQPARIARFAYRAIREKIARRQSGFLQEQRQPQ